jgi:teichuronic acid biosynthesis glycosyltransferase TuaC
MRILVVTNIYPTPNSPASGTFVEQQVKSLRHLGFDIDVMFVDRTQKGMCAYLGLGRKVRSRIGDFQADAVHVMYGGIMADEVTSTITDRPTVVSFCGSDLLGERLSGYMRKLISQYGVFASHRAARRTTGIIVKSKQLQALLPDDVDRSKVRIIPNGIDLERFQPLDRNLCCQQLGWDIDCFHILFPANSGDLVKRPALARASINIVNRQGIQTELHPLQGIPHHEVQIWLNASDAVLLTSLHEGSPNVIKEALACNVPIVSVDVGDVRERIEGIEGCYLALPDPDELAAKLHLVYAGARRIAGREKVQELALQRVAGRLKEFYSDLLHSRSIGPYPVSS